MKHVTFGDKALFVGDEAADSLTAYAAVLSEHGHADTVVLSAIGPDGHAVEATFVLDSGASLMTESADDVFKEPDNATAIRYMAERTESIVNPPFAQAATGDDLERSFGEEAEIGY